MLIVKNTFAHIRSIQIKATRNVDDLFGGMYRSVFKGRGLEFEDVREYESGDEIRSIDWNVTARMQNAYVKNYREERELSVMLLVDISASSRFGHASYLKSELIAEIAALLAFSAIKNQDKVGLLLFSDQIELYLRPKKGSRHVLRIIRELLYRQPKSKGTDLKKALAFFGNVQRKQTISFIISDFLDENYQHELNLIAKKHELIAINVFDLYEKQLPGLGLVQLHDLESNTQKLIDTSDEHVQKKYQELYQERHRNLQKSFGRAGADFLSVPTDASYPALLKNFFKKRGRKS